MMRALVFSIFFLCSVAKGQGREARCEREIGRLRERLSRHLNEQFSAGQAINEGLSAEFERAVGRSRDRNVRRVTAYIAQIRRRARIDAAETERFLEDLKSIAWNLRLWDHIGLVACPEDSLPRALERADEWRRTDGAVRGRHYCLKNSDRIRPVQASVLFFLAQDPANGRSEPVARFCTWFGGSRSVDLPSGTRAQQDRFAGLAGREGRTDFYVCTDLGLIGGRNNAVDALSLYASSTDEAHLALTGSFPEGEARVAGVPLADYVRHYLRSYVSRGCASAVAD